MGPRPALLSALLVIVLLLAAERPAEALAAGRRLDATLSTDRARTGGSTGAGAAGPGPLFAPFGATGLVSDGSHPTSHASGAIGPGHYVEAVDSRIAVFDRAGRRVSSQSLSNFTGLGGASRPQVQWDPRAGRWFYALSAVDPGANPFVSADDVDFLALGYSKSADPTDLVSGWCRYELNTDQALGNGGGKADFEAAPKLGHDDGHVLIGTNAFGPAGFVTARVLFYTKPPPGPLQDCPGAPVLSLFGSPAAPLRTDRKTLVRTPVPANTQDASTAAEIVSVDADATGRGDGLQLWHVDYAAGRLVSDGEPATGAFRPPAPAPQPGTRELLDTGDGRLTGAVAAHDPSADGREAIWTQHTVAGAGGRSVVRWYEALPATGGLRQSGTVADRDEWMFNAAISPTRSGDRAIVLAAAAGRKAFVSLRALGRTRGTRLGRLTGEKTLTRSPTAATAASWADSAAASPDPLERSTVWGTGQLAGARNGRLPAWTTRNVGVLADVAGPVIRLTVPGRAVRLGARVRARYSCTDEPGGSGTVSCVGTRPRGARVNTRPGRHSFTVRARDRAGHTTVLTRTYRVDGRAPVITVRSPVRGAAVRRGARLIANYSCRDERGGSGIASCSGTVRSGRRLDTARSGRHVLAVIARDRVGHRVRAVRAYRVR